MGNSKKDLCIKFLDTIKELSEKIEVQSKPWKHKQLDLNKDWILKRQSKIREKLHTGNIDYTNWCYDRISDFLRARSSKFMGLDIFGAINALADDELAAENDIRWIHTIFKTISMYEEFKEEEKENKPFEEADQFFEDNKTFYMSLPAIGNPAEVPEYTERYKERIEFAKKYADRYRLCFRFYDAYKQIVSLWKELEERRL